MIAASSHLQTGNIGKKTSASIAVRKDTTFFSWTKLIWWNFIAVPEAITINLWTLFALSAKIKVYAGQFVPNAAQKKTTFFTVHHAENLPAQEELAFTLILLNKS